MSVTPSQSVQIENVEAEIMSAANKTEKVGGAIPSTDPEMIARQVAESLRREEWRYGRLSDD